MNEPLAIDPRRRIRELLAIPERDRTDEQWDELNELEIRTAPGNRESAQSDRAPDARQGQGFAGQNRRPDRNHGAKNSGPRPDVRPDLRPDLRPDSRPDQRPLEVRVEGRPPKRQHRRPKRPVETPGNS